MAYGWSVSGWMSMRLVRGIRSSVWLPEHQVCEKMYPAGKRCDRDGGCWGDFFLTIVLEPKGQFFIWLSLLIVRDPHPSRWATSWNTVEYPITIMFMGLQTCVDRVFRRIVIVLTQYSKNHCILSFLFSWNILICICNFSLELHCIHCPFNF